MELVYLWVEEYKNIHNQGFNFSPKFNCNYDPNERLKRLNEIAIEQLELLLKYKKTKVLK